MSRQGTLDSIAQIAARLSAVVFMAIVCFLPEQALAAPERAMQRFLFATAHCLDHTMAPYSIPATTFDPVIYTMSVGEQDATPVIPIKPEDIAPCDQAQDAATVCAADAAIEPSAEGVKLLVAAHSVWWTRQAPEPPAEGPSCSAYSGERCESSPPMRAPLEVKAPAPSAPMPKAALSLASQARSARIAGRSPRVLATLHKRAATRWIFPPTPPPRA